MRNALFAMIRDVIAGIRAGLAPAPKEMTMIGPDDIIKRVTQDNAAALARAEKAIDEELVRKYRSSKVSITIQETDPYIVQTLVNGYRKAGWSVSWNNKGGTSQMDEAYTELYFEKHYDDHRSIEDIK